MNIGNLGSLKDVAEFLGLLPERLYLFSNTTDRFYRTKKIPKRNGKLRNLEIPCLELKGIQKLILKNIFYEISISNGAYGFVQGRSIVDAARLHHGERFLIKMDIQDFFPSISFKRVVGLLMSNGFPVAGAVTLARLCTYQDHLPQGAPTSPFLSNLLMRSFDNFMKSKAEEERCSYSRYADDIAISGKHDGCIGRLAFELKKQISSHGFQINQKKTVIRGLSQPRAYLGINLSGEKLKPKRSFKRRLRSAIHNFTKANSKQTEADYKKLKGLSEYYRQVAGIDYIWREASATLREWQLARTIKEHQSFELD